MKSMATRLGREWHRALKAGRRHSRLRVGGTAATEAAVLAYRRRHEIVSRRKSALLTVGGGEKFAVEMWRRRGADRRCEK